MYGVAKVGAGVAGAFGAVVLGLVCLAGGTGSSVGAQGAVAVTVLGQLAQDECVASGPVPDLSARRPATPKPSWPRPWRSVRASKGRRSR